MDGTLVDECKDVPDARSRSLGDKRPFEDVVETDLAGVDESVDQLEVRSVSLGEKRAFEDGVETDLANKKARGGGEVRLGVKLKKVAEIVLVLATMGKMRAGRKPTSVEVKMMAEAREILVEVCKEFAPKDVFPRDAFGTIIEDLGLNRLRETKLGFRPLPKLSIAQRLQHAKQKMEKPDVFPSHSATYTPEPHAASIAVRTFPSGKAGNAPIPSGNFQHHSTVVNTSPVPNSRTLPYQLPTSEVRPGGTSVLTRSHLGRLSTASPIERAGRMHPSDEISNANLAGDHRASNTPTWSVQSQSASLNKAGLDNGSAHLTNINHHVRHRMNFVQAPAADTHNEIGKIVQKILQMHMTEQHTWTPPSKDYMNKALTCQTCKGMINEVDSTLVCDACERGYHLKCLQSNPKSIFGDEWHEWHCVKCLTISNGKPIPPKYGRVMRNINTQKMSASMAGVQSSDENFNQRLMAENGNSASQSDISRSSDMQINGARECGNENSPKEKCQNNLVESHKPANLEENHQEDNQKRTLSVTYTFSNQLQDGNLLAKVPELSHNGIKLECNRKGKIREDEGGVEKGNIVKTSETCTTLVENKGSSSRIHDVKWVGGVVNEVDGKTYYRSCCISGTTYQLQDYALFKSTGNNLMPNKLQGMWEDNKTNKKWVSVTRCFFPADLPVGVGRPCAPENNEVYESNHETTLAAGLINGPCEVLPPCKFSEERVIQSSKPLFLCKWFYDEKKRVFRDVTC